MNLQAVNRQPWLEMMQTEPPVAVIRRLLEVAGGNWPCFEDRELAFSFVLGTDALIYLMYGYELGLYKIGFSNDPTRRRREHERSTSNQIEILVQSRVCRTPVRVFEAQLHQEFESCRVFGEWFDLDVDNVDVTDLIARMATS